MTTATGHVGTTGLTIRMLLWNRAGLVWNGSAYETYDSGNWASYRISTTEIGVLGSYRGDVPSGAQTTWARATFHVGTTESLTVATDGSDMANVVEVNGTTISGDGSSGNRFRGN